MAHLRKRGETWYGVFYLGKVDGKKKYDWKPLSKNYREAKQMLQEFTEDPDAAQSLMKLSDWVVEYLQTYAKPPLVSPSTADGYERHLGAHILPVLGDMRLCDIKPIDVQRYMAQKLREGQSERSVLHQYRILKRVLNLAVASGYIAKNPCDGAVPPEPEDDEPDVWTADEAVRFLLAAKQHSRYFPLFATSILTGLRRSEVLGLKWKNIHFDEGCISVTQVLLYVNGKVIEKSKTKTKRSRRKVAVGEGLLAILAEHQRTQNPKSEWVFTNRNGGWVDPHNLSGKYFPRICELAGVRRIPFKNLRHTHLSDLLAAGIHLAVISGRAGHASVDFTRRTYVRVMPDLQREAAAVAEQRILHRILGFAKDLQNDLSDASAPSAK